VIHDTASRGFSRGAEAYERGRPGYPSEAIEWLVSLLPERALVLDLAAGTGKLTRPLLDAGLEVVAVEPVAEMRAALPSSVRALDGTAEAIPLDDGSVDAVTVAQAFHWFDADAALPEIHRVLRPRGVLAMVWNDRDRDAPVNRAMDELLEPHRSGTPTHRDEAWRPAFARTSLFETLERRTFANEQQLDADGMEARLASISFIASLGEKERSEVVARARALPEEGTVVVPYRTEVLAWRRA